MGRLSDPVDCYGPMTFIRGVFMGGGGGEGEGGTPIPPLGLIVS